MHGRKECLLPPVMHPQQRPDIYRPESCAAAPLRCIQPVAVDSLGSLNMQLAVGLLMINLLIQG
ncbi:hypothetical protein D3C80_1778930 [compost metagenome]